MAAESSKVNDRGQELDQDDPEAIRRNIQATRDNLSETIDAIQRRLSPDNIKEQAVGSVRRATIGRVEDAADEVKGAGNDVFESIRRNPAPAVLAAVGLGWLFMESRNQAGSRNMRRSGQRGRQGDRYYYAGESYGRPGYDYTYDEYGRRSMGYGEPDYQEYGRGQGMRDRAAQAGGKVQDTARQAGDKVQNVAGQAADTVQDAAQNAKETASQVADQARQGVQQVAQQAQYGAQQVGSRFGEMMDENPLLIGAAALAIGAIVGFAFPATEKENQIMGEARDRVVDQAQQKASETAEKVQQVAQEATDAAKDAAKNEAQRQNLTQG
jgi:hypothetical protein